MSETIKKIKNLLIQILSVTCVALFILIIFLGLYQVIVRYVFNSPSSWSEELLTYGFAWMALLGLALVAGRREHMRLTFILDKFKFAPRLGLEAVGEIVTLLFSLLVFVFGGISIVILTMPQITPALQWRTGLLYLCIPIAGVFIALFNILNLITLKTTVKEELAKAAAEAAATPEEISEAMTDTTKVLENPVAADEIADAAGDKLARTASKKNHSSKK